MKTDTVFYRVLILLLRLALVLALFAAGWLVYTKLPPPVSSRTKDSGPTALQIVIQPEGNGLDLDIPVELYPVDIAAVRHEYFTERREGKRFDDFLRERMKGRTPVTTKLDKLGQARVLVPPGDWWVHAVLTGQEDLEWRLRIAVSGGNQIITLTPRNAYARTKSF